MMMFGNGNDVPLTDTYKQALYAAAAQGEAAVQATYPVFGSHVLLGFTRAIRVVSKCVALRRAGRLLEGGLPAAAAARAQPAPCTSARLAPGLTRQLC